MGNDKKKMPRLKLKNPIFIAVWQGMGDIAYKTGLTLIQKLNMEEIFSLNPEDFFYPTGITIKDNIVELTELPFSKFYLYRNKTGPSDLVVFLSNAQPDLSYAQGYCQIIIDFISKLKIKTVITFAAMPMPIDHLEKPSVWAAATDNEILGMLTKYNIRVMKEGQISGMNGLFLGIIKKMNIKGLCLLGEIPLYTVQLENPKAVIAILEILMQLFSVNINLQDLELEAQGIQAQINQLIDFLKGGGSPPPPIGDEEIEHIKYALGQYTKLPQSVKLKIEQLFQEAKSDLTKASLLKEELDKWSVYREYEDRFLDLFKKQKPTTN